MVRADGDALVMHVGERPYVVVGAGTQELSSQILNLGAMTGMLQQLLPAAAQDSLEEFGAVEHRLPPRDHDAFTVVAARGGDDIWIEIRRRRKSVAAVAAPPVNLDVPPTLVDVPVPVAAIDQPAQVSEAPLEVMAEPVLVSEEPAPVVEELPIVADAPALVEEPLAIDEPVVIDEAPVVAERAPVLQMTRTVRIEVPPRAAAMRGSGVERLLRLAAARAASALFVTSDCRPSIRVEGDIRPLDGEPPLSRADVESAVMEIVPEAEQEAVGRGESTEWLTEFADLGRVRCITFTDHRGPGVVFHMIATRAATAEQLGLSREVQALATEPQGLVLVAALPGNGKSTLVSALVDLVNRQRAEYVVTLERQIRLVHDNRTAIVSQREIRGGVDDALSAARAALREDPDVLAVDDLASAHMVPLLLQAASEGLVFVSITAPSTIEAVERFVELAPADARAGVRATMAETFRGAVAQGVDAPDAALAHLLQDA